MQVRIFIILFINLNIEMVSIAKGENSKKM